MTQPTPDWAVRALSEVYDPCCREKGISVVDMGLLRSVEVPDGHARVELLLTSGWCPFAARVLTDVEDAIGAQPGDRLLRGRDRLGRGLDDRPALAVRAPASSGSCPTRSPCPTGTPTSRHTPLEDSHDR